MQMALAQWHREGASGGLDALAKLQEWFYSHVVVIPEPVSGKGNQERKPKADKSSPDMFK